MTASRMRPADLAMALFARSAGRMRDTPPMLFAAMRFVVSALFVLVVPFPRVGWRTILALGLVIVTATLWMVRGLGWVYGHVVQAIQVARPRASVPPRAYR